MTKTEFYERYERAFAAVREVCGDDMAFVLVATSDEWTTGGGNLKQDRVAMTFRALANAHDLMVQTGELSTPAAIKEKLARERS